LSEDYLPTKIQIPLVSWWNSSSNSQRRVWLMGIFADLEKIGTRTECLFRLVLFLVHLHLDQAVTSRCDPVIMILPTIAAISRDALISLPQIYDRQQGLGATRWETILKVLLPLPLSGIVGR